MSPAKLAAVCGLTAVVLGGCGMSAKPDAGSARITQQHAFSSHIDDPRREHLQCIRARGYRAVRVGQTGIQVGSLPAGPTIMFEPTAGAAQHTQIIGQAQAAEVIGNWLLYPNQASDGELRDVETCVALDVKG